MSLYEIRRDFVDGTYDVAKIEASSIDAAVAIATGTGSCRYGLSCSRVVSTTLLCIVDLEPIRPLVVFA